jgi:hypothetical protein
MLKYQGAERFDIKDIDKTDILRHSSKNHTSE